MPCHITTARAIMTIDMNDGAVKMTNGSLAILSVQAPQPTLVY